MKTDQERIDALAEKIRNFNILVSGGGEIRGGFGDLPPRGQGDITIDHIEKAFSEFRLTGNNGIQAAGSLQHGYTLFVPPGGGAEGFPPSLPSPLPTGACCIGSDCSIKTESDCTNAGGTYQGDDTTCDPNPCPPPTCHCPGDVSYSISATVTFSCGACELGCSGTGNFVWLGGEFTCLYQGGSNSNCGPIFMSMLHVPYDAGPWYIDIFFEYTCEGTTYCAFETDCLNSYVFLTSACSPVGTYGFDLVACSGTSGTCHIDMTISEN